MVTVVIQMLYCRVTLGSVGVGKVHPLKSLSVIQQNRTEMMTQTGLRRPPEKRGGGLHDSVGQANGGNGMYVGM